jgi:hypothetical protein
MKSSITCCLNLQHGDSSSLHRASSIFGTQPWFQCFSSFRIFLELTQRRIIFVFSSPWNNIYPHPFSICEGGISLQSADHLKNEEESHGSRGHIVHNHLGTCSFPFRDWTESLDQAYPAVQGLTSPELTIHEDCSPP